MATELHFDRHMSDAEALMWRLEKDPYLSSTFASITVCDRPIDVARLRRRMEHAVMQIRRLRQRVQPAPGSIGTPTWVDDPDFEIGFHVRRIALPKPGTPEQLTQLATLIAADPFDRTRPLWQFVVVDGLRGGKGALIQKMHHTVVDGEAGVRLSLAFLDLDRDAPGPAVDNSHPMTDGDEGAPINDPAAGLRDVVTTSMRLPLAVARQIRDLLAEPARIPTAGQAALGTVRSVVTQLSDTDKARSPLWTRRSLRRRFETMRVPLDEVKTAAKALGGTVNTAFITAAAAAAGDYHRELGSPIDELRASMAISTRSASSGSNAFTLARLLVPTGKMPVDERFAAIAAAIGTARGTSRTASMDTLASMTAAMPTSLLTRLARQQGETVDFATSNVRGAPVRLFLAGAEVETTFALGPLGGVAFNLTVLSYAGSLDLGLNIDATAVSEPELLARCMRGAFAEFVASS